MYVFNKGNPLEFAAYILIHFGFSEIIMMFFLTVSKEFSLADTFSELPAATLTRASISLTAFSFKGFGIAGAE